MDSDSSDKIDEITNDIDEMKTTVDELAESAPSPNAPTLDRLKQALEEASDAADDLENKQAEHRPAVGGRPTTTEHDDDLAPSVDKGDVEAEKFPQTAEELEDRNEDEELDDEDIVGK